MARRTLYIVDYLKAFACLLIMNFHSDILFPDKLSLFAFGGDVGNNIFFMVSGFTLYPSIERTGIGEIGHWYIKRLKKMLPLLSMFYVASIVVGDIDTSSCWEIINALVFPTIYWFTGAIILFYPVLFIVEKKCPLIVRVAGYVILSILHLLYDGIGAERYFIGFMSMVIGYGLRRYFEKGNTVRVKNAWGGDKSIYTACLVQGSSI